MTSEVILHCDQLGVPCEMAWHGGYGTSTEFVRSAAELFGWRADTTRITTLDAIVTEYVSDYCPEHAR